MPDPNRLVTRRVHDVLVIELPEHAGIGSLELMNELPAVLSETQSADVRNVVVDCTQVTLAGSIFLEALVRLHQGLQEREGRLTLCGVNETLGEIMDLARFDTLWNRYATVDDAVQALTE